MDSSIFSKHGDDCLRRPKITLPRCRIGLSDDSQSRPNMLLKALNDHTPFTIMLCQFSMQQGPIQCPASKTIWRKSSPGVPEPSQINELHKPWD